MRLEGGREFIIGSEKIFLCIVKSWVMVYYESLVGLGNVILLDIGDILVLRSCIWLWNVISNFDEKCYKFEGRILVKW